MPNSRISETRRMTFFFPFILFLYFLSLACIAKQSHIPPDVKENIKARIEKGEGVGIVVGFIDSSGNREYFSHGFKTLEGEDPVDEFSVYEIGSISKVFTCTILADMVLKNEVRLNDEAQLHLPEEVKMPARENKGITLGHLASHTSGLARMPTNFAPKDISNPYADYSVENMYEFLSGYTLTRDIGEKFEYSNLGMGLLGHILSLKSGKDYETLLKDRICDALGMDDTVITLSIDLQDRLAVGHNKNGPVANWDIPTLAGAGAIRSTARDMLTFLAAHAGIEGTALSEAMDMTQEERADAGEPMGIGLGWIILDRNNTKIFWHNGGTGGYRSFCGFMRDKKIGVVVLSNMNIRVDDIGFHLLDNTNPLKRVEGIQK